MLYEIQGSQRSRLAVLAYDISCPRRARGARRTLDPWRHAKQYSVYEVRVTEGELRGVVAELAVCLDFSEDRLAVWWPLDGRRLEWRSGRLWSAHPQGYANSGPPRLPRNTGNFVVCYDVSDPDALNSVAAEVAAEAVMVQRSVYWLRTPTGQLNALLGRCAPHLAESDRLWAYPLRGSHALWQVGEPVSSILPISTHRWRPS